MAVDEARPGSSGPSVALAPAGRTSSEPGHGADDSVVPEPLLIVWNAFTAPWSPVAEPEERRRAQMLAGLVLVLLSGAFVLMFIVPFFSSSASSFEDKGLLLANVLVIAGGVSIYLISRTKHYEWGAWLMVFGIMGWVSVGVVAAEGTPWASSAPLYLALTVVLSTVLLPLVATLFVVALNLGLLLALYRFLPSFGVIELSNSITFIAISSVILVVTALVRFFDIRQIKEQSADIEESKERYRSLFEASFEGLALHADGKILEANRALADIFRSTRQELVGMPLTRLVARESRSFVDNASHNVANEARESEAVRADGERFPVEFISKPYLYQGQLVQVTGIRDITERKEMERAREKTRELELANRRLVELDRLRTRFLNVASHELNTPITPLRMQIHLLKTNGLGDLNPRQLNAVEILDRNLVRLSVLVKDILDVSKIEAGRLRLRLSSTEVSQIIEDAVDTFTHVANEKGIRLEKKIDDEAWVEADSDRLAQVISNLLSNALKFTSEGGHVRVVVARQDDCVHIEVADDGAGLTQEQANRLFRPFEQVHDVMQLTEGGSGLGLYISKGIIEAHGGEVGLDTKGLNKGVKVWFRLPLSTDNPPVDETAREPHENGPTGTESTPRGH